MIGSMFAMGEKEAKAINGGSIYITSGASMTIREGTVINGKSGENGGAIYIGNGSTLTMTGGEITNCNATNGGAIYIANGGTFIFEGGTISNCVADKGYAIYVAEGGVLELNGGSFSNCGENENLHIYYEGVTITPYIDNVEQESFIVADTLLSNIDMPLSGEECCGWFLNSELTQCVDYETAISNYKDNNKVVLYTKTATPEKLTFTLDSATNTYTIKQISNSATTGEVVVPREYNGKIVGSMYEASTSSSGAFYNNSRITNIYIPSTITKISNYSFYNSSSNANFKSINLHDDLTSIGNYAFTFCSGLTSITIGEGVTSIGYGAFSDCSGLTSITIGEGVTSIGDYVFANCDNLTNVTVSEGNTKYDSRNNCNAIIETSTNTLVVGCVGTIIPNSVTSIGDYAFHSCRGLTSIEIPNSVTSIGNGAFSSCSGLTSIEIPNSVTSIGDNAFYSCRGLTSITIGEGVTSIGDGAFDSCRGLTNIEIPNSVTSIGEYAFDSCSGLTSITIGEGVTSIGYRAFRDCTKLTSIYIPNSVTSMSASSYSHSQFRGCSSSLVIYCGAESKPSGWGTYWNYRTSSSTLTTYWGYTREEYEQAVGLANFAINTIATKDVSEEVNKTYTTQIASISGKEAKIESNIILNDRKQLIVFNDKKIG